MLNLKPQTQMKMEDDVPFEILEEQLKKMKTQEELETYISKLYKHVVQTMLKAEMDTWVTKSMIRLARIPVTPATATAVKH